MIPFEEMRSRVLDSASIGRTVTVPLREACGRLVVQDVTAEHGFPLFDNSAMDGFAVQHGDLSELPVDLRIMGVSSAGHPCSVAVEPGGAAKILTGAVMVDGADTVIPVEDTELVAGEDGSGECVRILADAPRGAHIRWAHEVIRPGDVVVPAGTLLNPGHLGMLASLGIAEVRTVAQPTVAVLSTGDELRQAGSGELAPGQIYESNVVVLRSLLEGLGCEVRVLHCGDNVDSLVELLSVLGGECDLVISTGGVSMGGDYDSLRHAAGRFDVDTVQVAMKPAKPLAFGRVGGATMFGLPGNPASVLISFESFVRPTIRKMLGIEPNVPPTFRGTLADTLTRADDGKAHFVPLRSTGDNVWVRTGALASHAISTLADAEAMTMITPEVLRVEVGTEVELIALWA
ncbi:MAG: gephyrin-like molybdotransferase Glp [Microthrixaceae bacterium]